MAGEARLDFEDPIESIHLRPGDHINIAAHRKHRVAWTSSSAATVWLAVFDRKHETEIPRGENTGRTLKNYNVVRRMTKLATWRGEAMEIDFDMAAAAADGRDGCAVIIQQGKGGPIIGAALLTLEGV